MWENSKMFNITSKYFDTFNNKPPASLVAHITMDFLHVIPVRIITPWSFPVLVPGDSQVVSYNFIFSTLKLVGRC